LLRAARVERIRFVLQVCRRSVDEWDVPSLLALEYPNGRIHELESAEQRRPGEEFDLYGHRWKVIGDVRRAGSRYRLKQPRLLCRQSL
jgi:hypothetical protein